MPVVATKTGKTSSLLFLNLFIKCLKFLLHMNLVAPWKWGVGTGASKGNKRYNTQCLNIYDAYCDPRIPSNINLLTVVGLGISI